MICFKEGSQPVESVDALEVVLRLNLAQALIKLHLGPLVWWKKEKDPFWMVKHY